MGTAEADVEQYFQAHVFPDPAPAEILQRNDRNPMTKHAIPDSKSKLRVSIPVPDMVYGYNYLGAFARQQDQLRSMGNEIISNAQAMVYPFFIVEFKADGPGGSGSMWAATNQCLGGSASCVNIAERLNHRLRQYNIQLQPINSAAFSIAMNGTEARLFVSWKHNELQYYTRKVDSFLLQRPKDYLEFRKHVLNIIDWGRHERLEEISKSLDILIEENRPPPSDESLSNSSRKRKSSLPHGRDRKGNDGANDLMLE